MKITFYIFNLCLALLVLCSGCGTFLQQGALNRAESGIEAGKYDFALRRLAEAEHYTTPTPAISAEIGYLKGICYERIASPDDANAMFKFVADEFPDTQYGYMAKAKLHDETFMSVAGPAIFTLYDRQFVRSIEDSWYRLLKSRDVKQKKTGTVIIKFNLHSDGKISDQKIIKNTTNDLLASVCQEAVSNSAPYESWTPDMVRAEGKQFRTITFSFYYKP